MFHRSTDSRPAPFGVQSVQDVAVIDRGLRAFMLGVYNWMTCGLLVTGFVALWVASSPDAAALFFTREARSMAPTALGWVAILSPLAFILVMGFGFNRLSRSALQGIFLAFAATMGISLSVTLLTYTGASVARGFFITAGMFGAMSVWGYTTGRDLSRMGSILMMALIGLIIASVVNMFLGSSMMTFLLSIGTVVIFSGLTAWDTQNLKNTYLESAASMSPENAGKHGIMGALTLYLNFINIFQAIMQLTGTRSGSDD